jgi:hypothetical protein
LRFANSARRLASVWSAPEPTCSPAPPRRLLSSSRRGANNLPIQRFGDHELGCNGFRNRRTLQSRIVKAAASGRVNQTNGRGREAAGVLMRREPGKLSPGRTGVRESQPAAESDQRFAPTSGSDFDKGSNLAADDRDDGLDGGGVTRPWAPPQGRETVQKAGRAVKDSYDAAQGYVREKGFSLDLGEFVRREPWLALAAAFAVGYVAARIIRRVS